MQFDRERLVVDRTYEGKPLRYVFHEGRLLFEKLLGYIFTREGFALFTRDGYAIKCKDQ